MVSSLLIRRRYTTRTLVLPCVVFARDWKRGGMMRIGGMRAAIMIAGLLQLVPPAAFAQSGIAGIVKDATGAVLPGVTVDAASPALIEKVPAVVTDEQGLYRIVELRPGPYSVLATLPGFATFRQDAL